MKLKSKTQIIINCEELETRFAMLQDGVLEEYEIQRLDDDELLPGSIYLGKITHLEPKLEAAFVDIGAKKNAFLHYKDMLPASYDMLDDIRNMEDHANAEKGKKKGKILDKLADKIRGLIGTGSKSKRLKEFETKLHSGKITVADIPKMFPVGSELLVQIQKGPIGTKGARVTTNISIPGRYLVLLPYSNHIGLSSKIDEKKERSRLRNILMDLDIPEGMGLICRTIGEGKKAAAFDRDLAMLLNIWHQADSSLDTCSAPALVYKEFDLLERTVRDFLSDDIDEIIVDTQEAANTLKQMFEKFAGKDYDTKIKVHNRSVPIFEHYKIADQVANIFHRIAPLPSGGYLCIDETEALVAIDVNSGKIKKGKDQPEVILRTNLEAAKEIARQAKLRDIGGLIVIDFIDMRTQTDRDAVYHAMKTYVENDRAKTKLLPISRFGLMEVTRQREHESIQDVIYDPCPYCSGSGRVKSPVSMSVEIQRKLKEILKRKRKSKKLSLRVIMHPTVLARLKNEDAELLKDLEDSYGKDLSFRADPTLHMEQFKLLDPETGVEY
ncbi:MAG: Rne/Rng family ribonuclease [Lentisphaerae bacterium]|nr:Rne/Rng family ribonuclease [Lentisphaerota bacterium]